MTMQYATPGLYYRNSNRIPPAGLLAGIFAGLFAGALAAVLYAYSTHYIPLIYVNVLLTFALGAVLGWVPARTMRAWNVRNRTVTVVVAMLVTAVCYYLHWAAWVFAFFQRVGYHVSLARVAARPVGVFHLVALINSTGTWGMTKGSENVNGIPLALVWLAEAAIIFLVALATARKAYGEEPFCETCGKWCPAAKRIRSMQWTNTGQLREQLEAHRWDYLATLGPIAEGSARSISLYHHSCPSCGGLNTLTAKQITLTRDKKGNLQTKFTTLIDKLLVSQQDVQAIAATVAPPPPPVPPAIAAVATEQPPAPPVASIEPPAPPPQAAPAHDEFGLR